MIERSFIAIGTVFARMVPVASLRSSWLSALVKRQQTLSKAKTSAHNHLVTLEILQMTDSNMILEQRKLETTNRLLLLTESIEKNTDKIEALKQKLIP